ncbi:MAG TPA: SDR family oxidoreductase [Bacteroidota bacterium]|nr:SDR family oxidoreductase [Bacteroidota bacterium]
MDLGLKNKIALVTASSQGLGRAVAESLAREGATVVVSSRNKKLLAQTAAEIAEATSAEVVAIPADVRKAREIKQLFRAVVKRFGTVHVLVNNAGGPPVETFDKLPDESWEDGVELTLMSVVRLVREAIPLMAKQHWGRIITINSIVGKQPISELVISSTLRPGLIGLHKVLAAQYAKDGILINTICPGFIMTKRQEEISKVRSAKEKITEEEYISRQTKEIPLRRYGTPQEIGDVAAFLASSRASFITGATISVDGGLTKGLL